MSTMGFVRGMITGAVIGGAAMAVFDPITPRQRRRAKKQAYAAFRNISNMTEDLLTRVK